MAQDDAVHQTGSEPSQDDASSAIHPTTIPGASSCDAPLGKMSADAVKRAPPSEYADWMDQDEEFDVVPARRIGAIAATLRSSGRATPTPYDFDG